MNQSWLLPMTRSDRKQCKPRTKNVRPMKTRSQIQKEVMKNRNEMTNANLKLVDLIEKLQRHKISNSKCLIKKINRPTTTIFAKKSPQKSTKKKSPQKGSGKELCSATKMDGKKCTAPSKGMKNGKHVCGRHLGGAKKK